MAAADPLMLVAERHRYIIERAEPWPTADRDEGG